MDNSGKNKLICFDVDGTLVETRSSWDLLTAGLGCPIERLPEIYEKTESGQMSFTEGIRIIEEMYKNSGKATQILIKALMSDVLLKADARETVTFIKQKGYAVYLISGGIDTYVEAVARGVGADGFFSHASLEFDVAGNFSKINYGLGQTAAKVARIKELSVKHRVPTDEIIFVGDGINDVGAFDLTRHGVAVYPYDSALENIAWKKIKELSELCDIV